MAGIAFVVRDHLELVLRHRLHVDQVGVVDACPRTVGRTGRVVLRRTGLLAERLDALDLEVRLRQETEVLGKASLDEGEMIASRLQVAFTAFVGIGEEELRIFTHEREELLQRSLEANLVLHRLHLGVDAGDLLEAEIVDLSAVMSVVVESVRRSL